MTARHELYRYFTSFGLTYRFGSIYSAMVNPRMEAATRGMFTIFLIRLSGSEQPRSVRSGIKTMDGERR